MKSTPRPWSLEIEDYGDDERCVSIPEIVRSLHDCNWADPEDWERDLANARLIVKSVNLFPELVGALEAADKFISNGIDLGFIRMPDADCPDPAKNVPPLIKAILKKAKGGEVGNAKR